ncbi:MAG: hypothetical protein U9R42_05760 [Bacteroidota bacterium]|nr:hypothetical protein [Bacteroidota bacterium]
MKLNNNNSMKVVVILLFSCHSLFLFSQSINEYNLQEKYSLLLDSIMENYSPFEYSEIPIDLPVMSDSVIEAIMFLKKVDSVKIYEFSFVMLLKLYNSQLQCCHSSYELFPPGSVLKDLNLIVVNFLEISGCQINEFITTATVYKFISTNSQWLEYKTINKEYFECTKLYNQIIESIQKND